MAGELGGVGAGAFRVADARALGVGRYVLRGKGLRSPLHGIRVPVDSADALEDRCRAAALVLGEGAAFSHATAARLLGLWLPNGLPDGSPHASVPAGAVVPVRQGLVAHQATWEAGDVVIRSGLPVTSGPRTLCDLGAARWSLVDLLVLADSQLRQGEATPAALRERVSSWSGRPGVRRLREVVELAREHVDSAMETRLRLLVHRSGLPEPVVNRTYLDSRGEYLHRPDLSWERWRVAADYDGEHHFLGDERQRRIDVGRKERMEEAGWTMRVFTSLDVLRDPDRTVERIRRALRHRGAPV